MAPSIEERVSKLPWQRLEESLWQLGYARTPRLLTARQCAELVALVAAGAVWDTNLPPVADRGR